MKSVVRLPLLRNPGFWRRRKLLRICEREVGFETHYRGPTAPPDVPAARFAPLRPAAAELMTTPRFATLTLNAALDVTLQVEQFVAGGKQSVLQEHIQAGGKGINVARVLQALGEPAIALAVVGGETGERIVQGLERDGIPCIALPAAGESRTCLEVVDATGVATQLHTRGVEGSTDLARDVIAALDRLPQQIEWFALCGSAPPGMPASGVRRILESAGKRRLRTAVDIRDDSLIEAYATAPDLLRINRDEWRGLAPGPDPQPAPAIADVGRPRRTVISDGAAAFDAWDERGQHWRCTPPEVEAINAIGCGDAMMAGLLHGLAAGVEFPEALLDATALASAEALSETAGRPDLARARQLVRQTRLHAPHS